VYPPRSDSPPNEEIPHQKTDSLSNVATPPGGIESASLIYQSFDISSSMKDNELVQKLMQHNTALQN